VAEASNADDADTLAGAGTPVTERRPHSDSGAEERSNGGEISLRMGDAEDEVFADDDRVGE
jgi:hypothetical protein